jgi:hypothetical protein
MSDSLWDRINREIEKLETEMRDTRSKDVPSPRTPPR